MSVGSDSLAERLRARTGVRQMPMRDEFDREKHRLGVNGEHTPFTHANVSTI